VAACEFGNLLLLFLVKPSCGGAMLESPGRWQEMLTLCGGTPRRGQERLGSAGGRCTSWSNAGSPQAPHQLPPLLQHV